MFLSESPMVESIRQMNLAAMAAQMASLPHHQEDVDGQLHKGGDMQQHQHLNNGGGSSYESTNWSKDLDTVTMWTPKTYSRPPPPIVLNNHNRPNLHGSVSLNDYSNVRPNNMRRWREMTRHFLLLLSNLSKSLKVQNNETNSGAPKTGLVWRTDRGYVQGLRMVKLLDHFYYLCSVIRKRDSGAFFLHHDLTAELVKYRY